MAAGCAGCSPRPGVPLRRSRAQQFGDLVVEAIARLEPRWEAGVCAGSSSRCQEVPDGEPAGRSGRDAGAAWPGLTRWTRTIPGNAAQRAADHPVPARAAGAGRQARKNWPTWCFDVVIEEFARLLGVNPEIVNPDCDEDE